MVRPSHRPWRGQDRVGISRNHNFLGNSRRSDIPIRHRYYKQPRPHTFPTNSRRTSAKRTPARMSENTLGTPLMRLEQIRHTGSGMCSAPFNWVCARFS